MYELGVACLACFCTFYTSEMNTQSYMHMQYYPGDSGLASYRSVLNSNHVHMICDNVCIS